MLPLVRASALALAALLVPGSSLAVAFTPFGPKGEGGRVNGQTFTIGAGGALDEADAFLAIEGQDLNGATPGTAAQLSQDALPAGLAFTFASSLSPDATDLTLLYTFTNGGAAPLAALTFLSFVDFEIDETVNTFFNEYAEAGGSLPPGSGFEVDEPGFSFGDIFGNLRAGVLDGTNPLPTGSPDDVSMALSFALGPLNPGQSALVQILLSEDGDRLGSFALTQRDADPASSGTVITFSGAIVPEPGTGLLVAAGLAGLASRARRAARRS